ncbi:hypothetical protein K438DRAFT_1967555 [Mycena galopus ATCC 62051]|nr:hypothetical protein K438DRAFT_1967555 [Mycena galopus ATCC 62051]
MAKHARFDAMESASTARAQRGSGPTRTMPMGINQFPSGYVVQWPLAMGHATVFEIFVAEKMAQISRVIERQLGEVMEAPPKAPRMRDPPMYKGDNDDEVFMAWLGRLVTFLQGYSLGGPKYDTNRIVYLKSALDSHALKWFASEVEPIDRDSDISYEFESIICAMHRRFVTSATATKATQDFEGVQYDPTRGIEYLVSELRRTASKMREPPAEFTIRQRFMRLIPSDVHDELISRGMHPEYTELDMLKNHARVWLEGRSMMKGRAARTTLRPVSRSGTPRGVPVRQNAPRATAWASAAPKPAPVPPRTVTFTPLRAMLPPGSVASRPPLPNSAKTCVACGLVGHIASDPKCAKFNESASRAPRPALRAGRVESSYSIDGDHTEVERDAGGIPTEDELEGTWGRDQYDADELLDRYDYPGDYDDGQPDTTGDRNEAPDLETLIQEEADPEIRVGAMRPIQQYFSMRQMQFDMDVTVVNLNDAGHTPWTADGEHRAITERGIGWDTGIVSHERLLTAFYEEHGGGALPEEGALELAAVEAIGAEEHARGFAPELIRSTAVDVEFKLSRTERLASETQQTITDLRVLMAQRQSARVGLRDLRTRTTGSGSRAPILGERALDANRYLTYNMTMSLHRGPSGPAPSTPPSYPGSPHDSDGYYPDDESHMLSRVRRDSTASVTMPSTASSLSDSTPDHDANSELVPGGIAIPDTRAAAPALDEVVVRSVEVLTSRDARRVTTFVTLTGDLRVGYSALPQYHRLNPEFQEEHRQAMNTAVTELAEARHRSRVHADHWVDWGSAPEEDDNGTVIREVHGFPDQLDRLFQGRGLIFHEGLASTGPDGDSESAWPGFRAQVLAQRVEHLASVRRPRALPIAGAPKSVGLMDQPN